MGLGILTGFIIVKIIKNIILYKIRKNMSSSFNYEMYDILNNPKYKPKGRWDNIK